MKKLNNKSQAKNLVFFIAFVALMIIIVRLGIMNFNTSIALGSFVKVESIRGSKIAIYTFEIDKTKYKGNFYLYQITDDKFKRFKNGKPLKIQYSKWFPSFNRLDDSEKR